MYKNMFFVHYDIFCLVCVSCRVVLGFLVTSSPLGLISSTTRGVMTVTTTWRGASCLRTSKPGNPLNAVHKTGMWKKVERSKFNGCLSIVSPVWLLTATSGGAKAAASVPTSEETTVTTSLLLQRSSAITDRSSQWLLLTCGIVFIYVYFCTVSLVTEAHGGESLPLLDTYTFLLCLEKN